MRATTMAGLKGDNMNPLYKRENMIALIETIYEEKDNYTYDYLVKICEPIYRADLFTNYKDKYIEKE